MGSGSMSSWAKVFRSTNTLEETTLLYIHNYKNGTHFATFLRVTNQLGNGGFRFLLIEAVPGAPHGREDNDTQY